MASNFIPNGDDLKEEHHRRHHRYSHHQQGLSPRGARRTLSTNSSSSACSAMMVIPKCLCAPTTHAGSFKCRLHRANSTTPTVEAQKQQHDEMNPNKVLK